MIRGRRRRNRSRKYRLLRALLAVAYQSRGVLPPGLARAIGVAETAVRSTSLVSRAWRGARTASRRKRSYRSHGRS